MHSDSTHSPPTTHLNLKVYDPQCEYGPNILGCADSLAIPLHDRASYECACDLFGVVPKCDAAILSGAGVFEGEDYETQEWHAMGRDARVSFRLDSVYYFALKAQLAEPE